MGTLMPMAARCGVMTTTMMRMRRRSVVKMSASRGEGIQSGGGGICTRMGEGVMRVSRSRLLATSAASSKSVSLAEEEGKKAEEKMMKNWELKLLYDGECPLCVKEVNMLRRRDAAFNGGSIGAKLLLVDIA